jgi:hypothetical protein
MLLHMILGDAQSIPSSPVLPPSAPVLFFFFSFKGTSPASAPLFRSISETFRIISEIVRRWLVCFRSLPLLLLLHSVVGTGNSSSKKGLEPYEAFSPSRMKNARYIRNQDRKGGRVGSENRGGGSFLTASFQVDGRQKPPPKGGPKPSPKGGPFDEVIVRRTRCTQNFAGFWRHQSVLVVFRASCAPDPVRLIQAHTCIQNLAGSSAILVFTGRKKIRVGNKKPTCFGGLGFLNHFTCFVVLQLRGNNQVEGRGREMLTR